MKIGPAMPNLIPARITLKKLEGEDLRAYEKAFGKDAPKASETYVGTPDTHPSKRRADVVVAGQWVATIYESGEVNASDRFQAHIRRMNNDGLSADQIARRIASAVGGTIAAPRDWE